MDRRVELLAPAGNPEGFYGAIHAGADAVYLGGKRFGARAYADNFTEEELLVCIRYAHLWGRKVYLTVNTLVKETEFEELFPYLRPLYEAGLDGVIVQDLGVMRFIRENFPDMELHVSTQMTLTGRFGAGLLKEMGASRIVPARELGLGEIREIKERVDVEVETFIHGAMCYCYSGQCLFSSILGGRSGNRGRCAQPCRLPYQVQTSGKISETCYPLSLKDMCTIEHLPELIESGIDSFKIEGRMKKPEYAAGVTAIYRRYIDRYYAGESRRVDWEDLRILSRLYIRSERQDGYYFRYNGRDMVALDHPSYANEDCGGELEQIREAFLVRRPRIKIGLDAEFAVGSPARLTLSLDDPHRGRLQVQAEGERVLPAEKRPITEDNLRRQLEKLGDTVFQAERIGIRLEEGAFYPLGAVNELRRQAVSRLEDALILQNGFPVSRSARAVSRAKREGLPAEAVPVETGPGEMVPMKVGPGEVGPGEAASMEIGSEDNIHRDRDESRFHVLMHTEEQLKALEQTVSRVPAAPDRLYLDADLVYRAFAQGDGMLESLIRRLERYGSHMLIALPVILRSRDEKFLSGLWQSYARHSDLFFGFLVRSMDGLGFLKAMMQTSGSDGQEAVTPPAVYTDAGLYLWNRESLKSLGGINGFCLPYELNAHEQRKLIEDSRIPCEKIVYGRIPLMVTANCVTNTMEGCQNGKGDPVSFLTDRYKKRFPTVRNCAHCVNVIYNSLPLSLHKELGRWMGETDLRLDFTIEDRDETGRILQYFLSGEKGELPYEEYTCGHEKRGAE